MREAGKGDKQRPTDQKAYSSGYDAIWGKKNTPITSKEMVQFILKTMDDVANDYPEEGREELKAVMLGQLGMAMFNGPKEKT